METGRKTADDGYVARVLAACGVPADWNAESSNQEQ
jgi:hypothetical protein